MKRTVCLSLLVGSLSGCSDAENSTTGEPSCDETSLPDPGTSTSTGGNSGGDGGNGTSSGEDDVTPGATAYPGPCTVWRDDDLDGAAEAITRYTYDGNDVSIIQYDAGANGTNDETYLYSYEQGRLIRRTDVALSGALLRTWRYFYDEDDQLSYVDLHGADDVRVNRTWQMHLADTGITSAKHRGSTLLRSDTDAGADGTIEGHMTIRYDSNGNAQRWKGYSATALSWVQNVTSRDTRGNALLVEVDVGDDGTIQSRSVLTYDCWSNAAFQPGTVQQAVLKTLQLAEPALATVSP